MMPQAVTPSIHFGAAYADASSRMSGTNTGLQGMLWSAQGQTGQMTSMSYSAGYTSCTTSSQQAPSQPRQPALVPATPGMSFGELEARLKSSWEVVAREGPPIADKEASPTNSSPRTEELVEIPCISLAGALEPGPSRSTDFIVTRPLKAFRKEGLFCPGCASRTGCAFHGDSSELQAEPLTTCLGRNQPMVLPLHKVLDLSDNHSAQAHCNDLLRSASKTFALMEEETSTEAGSSEQQEPWYGSSDGWSDFGESSLTPKDAFSMPVVQLSSPRSRTVSPAVSESYFPEISRAKPIVAAPAPKCHSKPTTQQAKAARKGAARRI